MKASAAGYGVAVIIRTAYWQENEFFVLYPEVVEDVRNAIVLDEAERSGQSTYIPAYVHVWLHAQNRY